MKLLFEYTLDYIKRNRRGSIAIMVAILMTATMMSTLCGFLYNIYADNLNLILSNTGNWHGELFDDTPGSYLPTIREFNSIESIMIKGTWKTVQIDDPRRDYLALRDANADYWQSMPEGDNAIIEGRAPTKVGEIALSKQYFEHHPELKLGDTLTLPQGNRVAPDGSIIEPQDIQQPGEKFVSTDTVALTVVGKLDVATSSRIPAYVALGFLDDSSILPDDKLTIYFRFHNIRDTYKELPKIAAAVGYEPDEYGEYLLRYNTDYLTRKAVLSPEQMGIVPMLLANQAPLMFLVMGLLTVAVFVLIIHNAFALSSAARISQLGIFASVGATPKQIKRSVVLEALLLTAIPLPLGLLIGQIAIRFFIHFANSIATVDQDTKMLYILGWQSVLPAVLLTILTVCWSALIPAKKIARMSPIAAIRQGESQSLKRPRRFSIATLSGRWFGIPGELAANALHARKKSYRTATISLTLSFLTLATFLCINTAATASEAVYQTRAKQWEEQDILLTLYNVPTEEDFTTVTRRIHAMEEVNSAVWYNTLRTAAWLSENDFSAEFKEKGGFEVVEEKLSSAQVPLLRDGKRRVNITLLGLDDNTFAAYCDTLGIDSSPFYKEDRWRSILYHTVLDVATSTMRNPVEIPFFNIAPGDVMTLTEEVYDSYEGDFTFDIEIAAIADRMPSIGSATFNRRYSAIQIMPMSQIIRLGSQFARSNTDRVDGVIQTSDPSQITPARNNIEQICESYFGSGDYDLLDENEYYENKAGGQQITTLMFGFIVGLLSIIGLSNAWSTVRGTLNARRREFAMLRSVGLPPQGLRKMLSLEAILLGITPILFSLPLVVILQGLFLSINEITFLEWLPYAPWLPMSLYIVCVLAVIVAAYVAGSKKIIKGNIIETIKVDSL